MTSSKPTGLHMERSQRHIKPHWWREGMGPHMEKIKIPGSRIPTTEPGPTIPLQPWKAVCPPPLKKVHLLTWHYGGPHVNHPSIRAQVHLKRSLFKRTERTRKVSISICVPLLGSWVQLFPIPGESDLGEKFHRAKVLGILRYPTLGWLYSVWHFMIKLSQIALWWFLYVHHVNQ